jgi:hypothetical protein
MIRSSRSVLLLAGGLAAACFVGCSGGSNSTGSTTPSAGAPAITTQPASTTVVSGAGATFTVAATGNGTLSYQWRKDGSVLSAGSAASLALTVVTAADAGVYDCIVTNSLGGSSQIAVSSGAILAVNTAPVIVAQPAAQSTAPGGSVIFMVAASGNGTLGYQWKKDGVDILGATQASYTITSATPSHAGDYSCIVTNRLGATSTSTATGSAALAVTPGTPTPPVISSQPAAVTVAAGDSASFAVAATGNGTVTYQWRKNGVLVVGAISATLSLPGVTPAGAGVYDCVVTNTLGGASSMAVSAGAILAVNAAPVILAQPANQTAPRYGAATFTVVAAASGSLGYQWRKDLVAIPGATGSSYTLPSVADGDVGSYDCVVTSALGSTTSSATSFAATLTIATAPLIAGQSGAQTVVEGGTASFGVSASGAGTLSYRWYKGSIPVADGGRITGATTATLALASVTLADAASYSCLVTSTQGGAVITGTSSGAALVVVATPTILTQPAALTVAQGGSGSFSVGATSANGVLSYQWRKNGGGIAGATSSTLSLASVAASDAGSYDCVVTNVIGGVTISVTTSPAALTVNTSVVIVAQPASVTQVEGGTATLTLSAAGPPGSVLSYQWKKGGVDIAGATSASLVLPNLTAAAAASYTCAVASSLNGTVSATVTSDVAVVAVNTVPTITTAPVAQGVATGSTATFSVAATATGTLSYQWRATVGGVTTNVGTPSASYTTPAITPANLATYDGATYDCVITSTLGIPATTTTVTTTPVTLSVAVVPTLVISSSAGASPNNFAGGEAPPTLTATVTNAPFLNGTVTYQWKKAPTSIASGVAILGATGSTYTLPHAVSLADAGYYTCTVTNTHDGAVATATSPSSIQVNVLAAPVITADLPVAAYRSGTAIPTASSPAISVSASAPAGGTLTYQWQNSTDGGATFSNVVGATSSSYAALAYPTGSAQQYRVVITNTLASGTATTISSACTVTLYQKAVITTQPVATYAVAGAAASLTVVPASITIAGTTQTVQWYRGISTIVGVAIPGATTATLSFTPAYPSDTDSYYAVVTNGLPGADASATSSATSAIVRLGVNAVPTIVSQPPAAPIAAEGTSFSLTVVANGAPTAALVYQWQKDGSAIAGANGASYTLPSPAAADEGSYGCVITSSLAGTPAQMVTAGPYGLKVNLKPTNLTPVMSGDLVNGPITLTVSPTNANDPGNPGSHLTYQWKRNGVAVALGAGPTYMISELTGASAGNYTCDVSAVFPASAISNASTATATSPIAAVSVGSGVTAPVVTMGSIYPAGKTGIIITTASQPGATYEWTVTGGTITGGQGTSTITVSASTVPNQTMTATVGVSNATGEAFGTASAMLVAAATPAKVLAPASVHPGDTWMRAGIDDQGGTNSWTVTGAGGVTGSASTTDLGLPFSASTGAVNGDSITLTANVQNGAGDVAPAATRTVSVTTGTWINKDGGANWNLGSGAAAAVFANGRVLVCGGPTVGGYTYTPATAAIYDPATQRWTRVADMNFGRTGHTATALPNGTILVTGGTSVVKGVSTWLNSAEVYDPATNTWILLGTTIGTGRAGHTATLLTAGASAGKVVIAGGRFGSGTADFGSIISVFQPSGSAGNNPGGSFSTSPVGLNLARVSHTATALGNGRVLIVGGQGLANETYQQAELFDATASSASQWSCARVGSLTVQPRSAHTATLLLDGKVLVAGGSQSGNTAEVFDPAAGTFTATAGTLKGGYLASNGSGRNQHAATRLSDGRVLLTGGQGGATQGVGQSAEIYDPNTGLFTSVTPMNGGRLLHSSVALGDGTVMVLGGSVQSSSLPSTGSTEIFDPAANGGTGGWTTIGAPGRSSATVTLLPNGRVMLVGGQNERQGNDTTTSPATSQAVSRTTHLYDPATGTWTDGPPLATARYSHSAVLLANGKLLVAGGVGPQSSNTLASAELYDPATNAWTSAGSMNDVRSSFGMIVLPGGKVLAIGGRSNGIPVATTELYDPDTNTWAYTSNGAGQTTLSEVKYLPIPVLLSNGKVVVAGGNSTDSQTPTSAVEVFDPVTQSWTLLTPLAQARAQHFPVPLPDGKFVLLGGRVPNAIGLFPAGAPGGMPGALEIYDTLANLGQGATVPTANAFFNTEGRYTLAGTATVLPNGKVLLAAGSLNVSTGASTSEIYDPAMDTLTVGPALTTGQGAGVLGVSLANGDLMLIGGSQSDTVTQIYRP